MTDHALSSYASAMSRARWARVADRTAALSVTKAASDAAIEKDVDPQRLLPPHVRAEMVRQVRSEHFRQLGLRSAAARAAKAAGA